MLKNKILKLTKINFFWWFGLFLITLFFHSNHLLNSDEGVILSGAWDLFNNKKLYFDFFEFISPGNFYLIFWAWKIFGAHYFVAKFIAILFVFFSSIGIYKISELITKSKYNFLSPLIFLFSSFYWPIINHNTFNLLFIIWATYFFIKGLQNESIKYFIVSGFFTGCSMLFLLHKGIVILGVFLLFLLFLWIKEKKKIFFTYSIYFFIFSLFPILILFLKWPFQIIYNNLIIFPLFNYLETNKQPLFLFFYFIFLFFIIFFYFKKIKSKSKTIWFILFLQFLLLLTTLQRPDIYHISILLFPFYCLIPFFIQKIQKCTDKKIKKMLFILLFLSIFIIIQPSIKHICYVPVFTSIKSDMFIYINNNCKNSIYIYAGPFIPGFYFETKKINPTKHSLIITNFNTSQQIIEAKNDIEKYKPDCAILNYQIVKKFNYNKNNPVDNYIYKNYKFIKKFGNTLIYKIK